MKTTITIDFIRTKFTREDFNTHGKTWAEEIARLRLPATCREFTANVIYAYATGNDPVAETVIGIVDRCFNPDPNVCTVVRRDPELAKHKELSLWFRITVDIDGNDYTTAYIRGDKCPVNVSSLAMIIHGAIRNFLKQRRLAAKGGAL